MLNVPQQHAERAAAAYEGMSDSNGHAAEEARIKAAYARRHKGDERYSWFHRGYVFGMQSVERDILGLLARNGYGSLGSCKILEVGCGTGFWLRQFVKWGARPDHVFGVDLLPERVSEARRVCSSETTIACANAGRLDFADQSFDIVFQGLVFTSVQDAAMRRRMASEMRRVTRRGGLIIWYDFDVNNPSNPDVRAVKKPEIMELFPDCSIDLRRVGLAPPIYRFLAPHSWILCELLEMLPMLRTHQLGAIRPAGSR